MIDIRRKENESASSLMFRFTKKVQQAGVLREAKRRRFHARKVSKLKRKLSALHSDMKRKDMIKQKKMGLI